MPETDDRSELASRAWRLFLAAGRRRFEAMAHETDAMGLSRGMAQFLVAICTSPPGPTNQLAGRFGLDPGWVTQIVDRLEARGEIVRRVSPDDRRVKLLEVTDAGRRTFERIEAQFAAPPPELLEVPRDDLLAFVRIAERLAPPLEEADIPGSPTLPRR